MNISKLFLMLALGISLNSHIVGMNNDNNEKKRKNDSEEDDNNKQMKIDWMNIQDNNGNTFLHRMCMENNPTIDLIVSLINKKADPNITNNDGWTPLRYLCEKKN